MANKILAIIQARSASKRLPNKILLTINKNLTVIENIYKTLNKSKKIDQVIVATTSLKSDDKFKSYSEELEKISKKLEFFKNQTTNIFKNYRSKISAQTKMHLAYKKYSG